MRRPDWEARLADVFATGAAARFAWGRHDCCQFVVAACRAQLPRFCVSADLLAYDDEDGAAALLRRWDGVEGIAEWVAGLNGLPAVLPSLAQRGDVVLMPTAADEGRSDAPQLGVVDLSGRRVGVAAADGLAFHPVGRALRAWRV